jgi:NAD-reducing hydrogenase large subunit
MSRLVLDEIVDPFGASVSVTRAPDGSVREARFDLTGLPRVDGMLAGQPVGDVPRMVERLCGICPAAHHLAGVRALEALAGVGMLPPAARAVRRLLHLGSALEAHAPRLLATDRDGALALRRLGKAAMTAAGSPGHFPVTAVPGGVLRPVAPSDLDALADQVAQVLAVAVRAAQRQVEADFPQPAWSGADVALVEASGHPDLLGTHLVAVAADGTSITAAAPDEWDATVAEQFPGATAPRPHLVALGTGDGRYRVGPTAQLRVGRLTTPLAASLQQAWLAADGSAAAARAIITVHAVEAVVGLIEDATLLGDEVATPVGGYRPGAVGVGWVDGPRGLLVHRYATGSDGRLTSAQILTPTAQNEPWLADLLTRALAEGTGPGMEAAVREADPCLPCSSAPEGAMGLQVRESEEGN